MEHLAEPGLDALAEHGDWGGYGRRLASVGCGWWFRMDLPRLEHHLRRLLAHQSAGLSPRLRLLQGVLTPLPGAERLPGILSALGALHRVMLLKRDLEGAAACAGLALAAVWDFGSDFSLARPWLDRAASHLARPALPPLARAHLLAFSGLFELFARGDVPAARGLLERQAGAAVEAQCPELALYGACVRATVELFAGCVDRAEVILGDAGSFQGRASPTSHACVYFGLAGGVLHNAAGRPREALSALEDAASRLTEDRMPASMRLQLAAYGLMAASQAGDPDRGRRLEDTVRRLALADGNHLHEAFLHFGLGLEYLRAGRAYRGLVHAQEAVRAGLSSRSPVPVLLGRVLLGQALLEANETEEAESVLQGLAEESGALGLRFFERAAAVELAALALRRGGEDQAHRVLEAAGVADGEVFTPFRTAEFNDLLRRRLAPTRAVLWSSGAGCSISVETLGGFAVTVDGRPVYDRHWGSGRTQRLLKLLIALGGTKVPVHDLAEELWPEAAGDHAYANLKTALARLRRLGVPTGAPPLRWVHLKWGRLSLSSSQVSVDALHFRQSIEALRRSPCPQELPGVLEAYTGPFLPQDDHCAVIPRFRREVQQAFVWGVEELCAACARGDVSVDLPAHLGRAVSLAPDVERLHALRVRAFLLAGYRVDALRAYREAEGHFRQAFGVGPGPELRALGETAAS